jgi:hypothetical protein
MSIFQALFGATKPQAYDYHITLPRGTYKVTTDVHHDHPHWSHKMAEKIRSVVSDDDLATLRNGGTLIASVGTVGATAYTLLTGTSNKAAIRRIEQMLMELSRRR